MKNSLLKIKHVSFAFLLLFLLGSCKSTPRTPEEKAKALIAQLFEARENHTYGYEAGLFGKLDSAYSTYRDDSLYRAYGDTISYYLDKGTIAYTKVADIGYRTDTTRNELKKEKLWKELLAASAKQTIYNDSAQFYSVKSAAIKKSYKPFFNGWKIKHEYRANNGFGVQVSQNTTFYFNIPLTKITGPEEIVEFAKNKLMRWH